MYETRTLAAGLDPIAAAARLAGARGRVLLHSGRDDDGCGRWSFAACEPAVTVEAWGRQVVIRGPGAAVRTVQGDPLEAMAGEIAARDPGAEAARATGGPVPVAIGYLGYDLGRVIETAADARATGAQRRPSGPGGPPDVPGLPGVAGLPHLWLGLYDAVWRHDGRDGTSRIVARTRAAAERLARRLEAGGEARPGPPPALGPLVADDDAASYRARVERILGYIAAGDVYQVNLARRLVAAVRRPGDALALHAALHARAPAPYAALIEVPAEVSARGDDGVRDGGDAGTAGAAGAAGPIRAAIVSGSPERFLYRAADGGRLETRPIKGTLRRPLDDTGDDGGGGGAGAGVDPAAALASDDKERAEHLMIVDLERNDLGRVARTGTVRVDALGYVVALPGLYHMVSRVACEPRADVRLADILRATFPGGSITGAPKIRAMQIIDELEPAPRGPYTGAIGYFGAGGGLDLSIAIRGAVVAGGALRVHVGGGIVADSRPDRELEETEVKAAGWRAALRDVAGACARGATRA